MKDLIILVADQDMEFYVKGLLPRIPNVFSTREFAYDIYRHPRRDPGCRTESHSFLQRFSNQFRYAVVIFDHQGCGREAKPREDLELEIEGYLKSCGWEDRCACIVIDPELENWMWINSLHLSNALGWTNQNMSVYDWLIQQGLKSFEAAKPYQPKEALERVLRETQKNRSASIYQQVSAKAKFIHCKDASFIKFTEKLKEWFYNA